MRVLVVIVLIACGGSKAPTTPPPPKETGASCGSVADSMVGLMLEGKEGKGNVDEVADGFRKIIRVRCEEDAWSAEARQCLSTMTTPEDAERCGAMLTETQQANLVRDQKAKYGEGGSDASAR